MVEDVARPDPHQHPHRYQVDGAVQRFPQPRGAVVAVVVVSWPVLGLQIGIVMHQGCIHEDRSGRCAILQGSGIDEGFEPRTRLAGRLQGVVVLVDAEVEAPLKGQHRAGGRVEGHQGALDLGQLGQPPPFLSGLDANQVTGLHHLVGTLRRRPANIRLDVRTPAERCHLESDRCAVGQGGRGPVVADASHQGRHQAALNGPIRQRRQPSFLVVELGFRAPVAVAAIIGDQPVAQRPGGGGLVGAVQGGVGDVAAGVEIREAVNQLPAHPLRREGGGHVEVPSVQPCRDGCRHGLLVLGFGDGALGAHSRQHQVAAPERPFRAVDGIACSGGLQYPGKHGELRNVQLV